MDSRHMQKVNCSDKKYWENIQLPINIVIGGRLTCNVDQAYMYMILVVNIYAFLITMGLLIQSSPNKSYLFHIEQDTIKLRY